MPRDAESLPSLMQRRLALVLLSLFQWALAVPFWSGLPGAVSIGSLVPGTSVIEATLNRRDPLIVGDRRQSVKVHKDIYHLSTSAPGATGNLSLTYTTESTKPPLFYISNNRLYQFQNETYIYSVNVLNHTQPGLLFPDTEETPLQLVLDMQVGGVRGGAFQWKGTNLFYEFPGVARGTNLGIYYSCPLADGSTGTFMFLRPTRTPAGCTSATLRSRPVEESELD